MADPEGHGDGGREADTSFNTRWSMVLAAGHEDSPQATTAMEELCRTYWQPVYSYIRKHGHPVEESKDLTQDFFVLLIAKHWVAEAKPDKGRFRTFLLTAVNHFLANEWRKAHAAKRGGGQVPISLDDTAEVRYAQDPAWNVAPEEIYERHWALSLFNRALEALREQYADTGKLGLYDRLRPFLSREAGEGDYAALAAELKISVKAVAGVVFRFRQRYRKLLRDEVAHTVETPAELEGEIRWLLEALNSVPTVSPVKLVSSRDFPIG